MTRHQEHTEAESRKTETTNHVGDQTRCLAAAEGVKLQEATKNELNKMKQEVKLIKAQKKNC